MSSKGATPPPAGSAVGASSTTAGLPAPPLQPPTAQSAYTPMPKPGADYGQTQSYEQQQRDASVQAPPTTAASPTPEAPTNTNAPALPEQGANVAGDVWAPGTGPSGGYNGYGGANGYGSPKKGGMPPSAGGQGGLTPGAPGSMAPQGAGAPQQPGGAPAFQNQYDAIQGKFGKDAAMSYAVKNWDAGGRDTFAKMFGGSGPSGFEGLDTNAYNAAINAHGAGGDQRGIVGGRTVKGPDGQTYYVASNAQNMVHGGVKKGVNKDAKRAQNAANMQDLGWLQQNAVKF
jgi:hypothetical protein